MSIKNYFIGFCILATIGVILIFYGNHKTNKKLNQLRQEYNVPALGVAIFDRQIDEYVVGVRKFGDPTKAKTGDKFHLGSCTKTLTATLFATIIEDRKIKFETTLKEVFPEVKMHKDLENVTMEMLLIHQSGIIGDLDLSKRAEIILSSNNVMEQRKLAAREILTLPPKFSPGLEFHYSNNGYILIGAVLEKIMDKSWEELMQERIFNPLHMESAGFGPQGQNTKNISQPWPHLEIKETLIPINPNNTYEKQLSETRSNDGIPSDNPQFYGPANSVHCSLRDWAQFFREQVQGFKGEGILLTRRTCHKLYDGHIGEYLLGGLIKMDEDLYVHEGSNTMNYSMSAFSPEIGGGALFVTNCSKNFGYEISKKAINIAAENIH